MDHSEIPAVQVHVPGYVQDADPGAIGADKLWAETAGSTLEFPVINIRDSGNTDWTYTRRPYVTYAGPPTTCATVTATIGVDPAFTGPGFSFFWRNTATGIVYLVVSAQSTWHYVALTACT